ncbi:MAG: hypothetical protein WCP77_21895, partial [Roseococcus sp.]
GELYLAVQFAPRSQATSLSGSLMLEAAEAPPPEAPPEPAAPPVAAAPVEAPPPEEPPAAEPPSPEPVAAQPGPATRRRVRALQGGASLVFRSTADAQACQVSVEDAEAGVIRLDPSRCAQDLRLILPLPPMDAGGIPEGLDLPLGLPLGITFEAAELGSKEKRSLLWLAVTKGASPVSLDLHLMVSKRIRARGAMAALAWDAALDPRVDPGMALYATLQIAGGGTPVLLTLPRIGGSTRHGAFLDAPGGALQARLVAGDQAPRILLHRAGATVAPNVRSKSAPEGASLLTLPARELDAALREAGWADGAPVEALLLAGDTLLDRRILTATSREETGALEEVTPTRIRGWAGIAGQPELTAEVELLVNGEPYETLAASLPGREGAGFETRLLLGTAPEGDVVALRGRVSQTLLGEPRLLTGLPQRVTDPARTRRATLALRDHPPGVTIILPLRDGDAGASACLAALAAQTPGWARVLLVDQGCTAPVLTALLKAHPADAVIRAEGGRTQAFNHGIAAAGQDDVVLLEPGTIPGSRWLQRLLFAAHAPDKAASISALNGGADALWAEWGPEAASRLLAQRASGLLPEMPAMAGACLYLRRAALAEVGPLDAESFPDG